MELLPSYGINNSADLKQPHIKELCRPLNSAFVTYKTSCFTQPSNMNAHKVWRTSHQEYTMQCTALHRVRWRTGKTFALFLCCKFQRCCHGWSSTQMGIILVYTFEQVTNERWEGEYVLRIQDNLHGWIAWEAHSADAEAVLLHTESCVQCLSDFQMFSLFD